MRAPTVISVLAYTSYCNSVHCEVPPRLSSLLPYSRRDERRPVRLEMTLIALCGIPPAPTRVTLYATPPRKYTRATPLVNFCLGTSAQTQTDPISNPNPTPTPNRLRGSRSVGRGRGEAPPRVSVACLQKNLVDRKVSLDQSNSSGVARVFLQGGIANIDRASRCKISRYSRSRKLHPPRYQARENIVNIEKFLLRNHHEKPLCCSP